ncbi:vanadium-dependent haloperoxidase [Longimicrobium terrae]|uniref:Phosphoesterase n=1 Tax=Longimicrobium terrae TaxID=1639882 RepID=A0A841GW59_9BACT|nr:vanadium-dependent haloperoxidase [Longimicrobium terrae]MBB4635550.1 hypothetical protein [Longimicrobium terrae]MBB6069944.1 hypothetical protein [Longimicrobium terrae]NNC32857.1 vanadium-dependent haloperoxidase [Longimicrobium terrae]
MAKAHTLVDNFNDNVTDPAKWVVFDNPTPAAGRIREVNGHLEIRPSPNVAGANYSYYESATTYDLTASQIFVEVVEAPSVTSGGVILSARVDDPNEIYFRIGANGRVRAVSEVGGTGTLQGEVLYDERLHRWFRLREAGGFVYWETSPDGVEWNTLARAANPIPLTAVRLSIGAGTTAAVAHPGVAVLDNFNVQNTSISRRVEERRLSARDTRVKAAQVAAERKHADQFNNNDEVNYPATPLAGNYSKSLRHDDLGDPDPASYATLLRALESRDPSDFEEIILGPAGMPKKLTNPQAGFAFDIEGPDAQEFTIPPAPRFDSAVTAHEMGELYWMAIARDVPFIQYSTNTRIADAVSSLNAEFPQFGGTVPVTAGTSTTVGNVFRGIYPGEQVGPYVSQFLLKGNVDPRKPAGQGRDAVDGFISYGARTIDQRLFNATPGMDYLFEEFEGWLNAQDGQDYRGTDTFETTKRFIHTLRAGATLVHFDQVVDAYWNAAWILMSEPTGNESTFVDGTTGRPQIDAEFPYNRGNPYMPPMGITPSRTQVGFATFGPTHLLQAVPEVLGRALRAVWWQKWGVHRRLRPEEFGGRVDNMINDRRSYPIDPSIITSLETGGLAEYYPNATYLLPQAYPEGAPTHPAYGAGHATGSGAMITILKAFFDDLKEIENPVQASVDGLTLVPYTRPETEPVMTVGGELNKLAGNIAIFRNAAGVHWRSDYTESLRLGEKVAIALLQEMTLGFNEDDGFFELTRLDGVRIRIFDGKVEPALQVLALP